jgi:membrane protease YdiL (CAAX protease family)
MNRKTWVLVSVTVAFLITGLVVAAEGVSSGITDVLFLTSTSVALSVVLKGAMMGVVATLLGWLKNQDVDKFDFRGLALKVPVGFIIGALAAYKGIDFNSALDWATGIGLVTVIDQLVKLVLRRIASSWGWEVLNLQDNASAPKNVR